MNTFLGFDVGSKRIGVAVGQDITATASPLLTLSANRGEPDWAHISQLVDEWKPCAFIIGLPMHADNSETPITLMAKHFADQLQGRFAKPVHFVDERLSSHEAETRASQRHSKNRSADRKIASQNKAEIDKIAAQIILQSWLNQQS